MTDRFHVETQEPTAEPPVPGTDLAARPAAFPVPALGTVVDLNDGATVARALKDVKAAIGQLSEARRVLVDVMVEESQRQGTKTLRYGDIEAVLSGGSETWYDVETLAELVDAGLPQERYEQLVTEVVTHKVDARVAKQLAGSNPAYAAIIERARRVDPKPWSVKV